MSEKLDFFNRGKNKRIDGGERSGCDQRDKKGSVGGTDFTGENSEEMDKTQTFDNLTISIDKSH